jgi:uncharacterized protein with von Willebrand factor type A (vWA) domain
VAIYPVAKAIKNLRKIEERHHVKNPRTFLTYWEEVRRKDNEEDDKKRLEEEAKEKMRHKYMQVRYQ